MGGLEVIRITRWGVDSLLKNPVAALWSLWPLVARIAAHELAPDGGIESLPEAGEVRGGLHGAMVGC